MIRALFLAIGQLGDRRILWVLVKSLAATLLLLGALSVGLWYGLTRLTGHWHWGDTAQHAAGIVAVVLAVLVAGISFRAVALLVTGLFADEVVLVVEAAHYPQALAQAHRVPLTRSITMGIGSVARFLAINLALLPLYLMLIATGVGPAILFFVVGGWLLGRDLGDMIAARHIGTGEMRGWRGATAASRFALGLIGTGLFVVPVVNLVAPVIVAAMATHWFHGGRTTA